MRKLLWGIVACFSQQLALAGSADSLQIKCIGQNTAIVADIGPSLEGAKTIYNLKDRHGVSAMTHFAEILKKSSRCIDLNQFNEGVKESHAYLCEGEVFLLKSIYDQIITTRDGPRVFVETISKRAGWACQYL